MENICPLCNKQFAEKDPNRKSLKVLIQTRGLKPTFTGPGPDVHVGCFGAGKGVRELIAETVRQEETAKTIAATTVAAQA